MTAGLTLMKSVLTPLAKKILLPFGLSAGMSEADAAIEKKMFMDQLFLWIYLNILQHYKFQ